MNPAEYYPSQFVVMRESDSGIAFFDLFTGQQLVLRHPVAKALASVFHGHKDFNWFANDYQDIAREVVALSFFVRDASLEPYLRAMLSSIDIEPAGSCNAVCAMCPRGKMTRSKTLMTQATFDAVCQQLSNTFPRAIRQIYFCGFGEPTQNPLLPEMSRRIRSYAPECAITVISNGSLLTDELIEQIVHSGIDAFSCSIQSNLKSKYEVLMRGLEYETTVNGLRRLISAARGTRLTVFVNMTATEENKDEIAAMSATWQQYGARFVANPLHNRGGFLAPEGDHNRSVNHRVARCGLMNSRLFISCEGDVLSCCHDLTGDTRIGNIHDESLTEILKRRLARISKSELYPICGRCTDDSSQVIVPLTPSVAE